MRILKKIAVILLGGALSIVSLAAQNRTVSGTVLDSSQQPIIGAAVMLQGTTIGNTTDVDGRFSLDVPEGDASILVTCLGYVDQNINVPANTSDITVILQEDNLMLEETVVVGYGVQKKVNLTGSISVVGSEELENRINHSVTNMLQGAAAGVNVTTSSGKPGSSGTLNIRGTNSINSAEPLVVIDGVTGDSGDLNRLNPNDVASISIVKDASAAAIYGARAAFGVILVTTKSGSDRDGKATVRYSGRFGWEEPTTSTDYENRGYWSVYTVNKFWQADNGQNYIQYTDEDMYQLLARVNDKTEDPSRPWTMEVIRNGKRQWVYYGNYDWWDMLYRKRRPTQSHDISISGGNKDIKYLVSGNYNNQQGMLRANPDVFNRYNLRAKLDFNINKWAKFSNNSSFFSSRYTSLGNGSIDDTIAYSARHALACFPMQNPDGSWLYSTPYINYKVANGRHILINEGTHRNVEHVSDFSNTSRLVITPVKTFSITADFTYRFYQSRDTHRSSPMWYREYPDSELQSYNTGAGLNKLSESTSTRHFYSTNIFATYDETFGDAHHVTVTAGGNYEKFSRKGISVAAQDLSSIDLDDLDLATTVAEEGAYGGGQAEYALLGFFARINYDYKGKYLFEVSGRYDGTSRFAADSRWGMFPSASAGWRISEEPFFEPAKKVIDNLKLRASFGSLGNQSVSSYYTFARFVSNHDFASFTFDGNGVGRYSSLDDPVAGNLTWETVNQWDLGIDLDMFNNRLNITADAYIRDTKNMLTDGVELPAVYGADPPKMNTADLRTSGYEITVNWRDEFMAAGKPFRYNIGFNLSDYKSIITRYDNKEKTFAKKYYEGMEIGEIWGFRTDGFFATDEEAAAYADEVDLSYSSGRLTGGWMAGDLKFLDLDGDGKWGIGQNTVDKPGDREILGNSLPRLSYGINAGIDWMGFDISVFLQGTGNHYWYPSGHNMNFWGSYSYSYVSFLPKNFIDKVWDENNTDSYFPRARAYSATGGYLSEVNDRYLQNLRYLRLKSLTVGYTVPERLTKKIHVDKIRVYFSGENLCYWSPLKKNTLYVDPEAAFTRKKSSGDVDEAKNNAFYPWPKTFMFGIDITF